MTTNTVCPISATAAKSRSLLGDVSVRFNPFIQLQTDDPYPILAEARQTEPIFYSRVLDAWIVTRSDAVRQVLRNPQTFLSSGLAPARPLPAAALAILGELPPTVPLVILTDPPEHTRRRRLTQSGVSPNRVSNLEPRVRAIAEDLIERVYNQGHCDFYQSFAYRFPLQVISSLLGFSESAAEDLRHWSRCRVALLWGDLDEQTGCDVARGIVDFYQFIEAEIGRRETEPQDDLISDMVAINAQSDGPLSRAELIEEVHGLVVAGHETTASWITMTLYRLLRDQTDWKKICGDKTLIPAMLEESLRFDGPVLGVWRRAAHETQLGDVPIAAGARVFCSLTSANRDECTFDNSENFQIERRNARQHVMFGQGIHTCVGASLARLEGRVAFEVLTERMPHARLAQSELSFSPNASLRLPSTLQLEWDI